ncbi:hypothetical protein E2C01_002970 [Portunus trituberculatus]|uniref:Uncharacterized protein n=1 Tax=Portunus trituberculatus TaxID=210409 RepID=A0A5B7CM63_PORTR|nr:hypothetical protein [Portunus trituberculatus]
MTKDFLSQPPQRNKIMSGSGFVSQQVIDEGSTLSPSIRTQGATVRLLSGVNPHVVAHGILSGGSYVKLQGISVRGPIGTEQARVWLLPRIATEGALVKLADASPPAKPRTITVQSHLLGTPILVTDINYSNKCCHINMALKKCEQTPSTSCGTPHITPPCVLLFTNARKHEQSEYQVSLNPAKQKELGL